MKFCPDKINIIEISDQNKMIKMKKQTRQTLSIVYFARDDNTKFPWII